MAIKVLMPALSPTMTEGNLIKWLKNPGDSVNPGDIIAEIETDKAVMEVESADSGVVGKILVEAGSQGVKVNSVIAVILEDGEDISSIADINISNNNSADNLQNSDIADIKPAFEVKSEQKIAGDRIFATPLAKRIAMQKGIDLSSITGSGPRGRIIKDDVVNVDQTKRDKSTLGGQTIIPMTQMRKTIAKRLQESKANAPHFYLSVECNVSQLLQMREDINSKGNLSNEMQQYKVSFNDCIVKAAAMALRKNMQINIGFANDSVVQYHDIDISIAVAIQDGLITPIVKNADAKSFIEISKEIKTLSQKAKNNLLKPEEFIGGSFTISNLGMYGVDEFYAIINPPQGAILAVGCIKKKPVISSGNIVIGDVMKMTLSCDHRIIDGAIAGAFLRDLKAFVESPVNMFI